MNPISYEALQIRIKTLEDAIRKHRDQRGDDRCWLDDKELYGVLKDGKQADFSLPPKCEFLESCRRFWEQRSDNRIAFDPHGMTIAQLQDEIKRLKNEGK